jgi:hypothetical protein
VNRRPAPPSSRLESQRFDAGSPQAGSPARGLDFLLVGAPRCGTTSLFEYLRRHPGVFVPAAKELPFFTDEARFARGWEDFAASFFAGAPPDALWGKLTPQYWRHAERAAPRIAAALPEVRLLVLLRNPVDRALSHYRFMLRRGAESVSFAEAVADPTGRKYDQYVLAGQYGSILERYLQHFDLSQVRVIFTEELEAIPSETLEGVWRFLGLDPEFRPANLGRRYNVGGDRTRYRGLVRWLGRVRPLLGMWRAMPERSRRAFARWFFFEVAPRREAPVEMAPALRSELVRRYLPEVHRLEEILCRSSPWPEFRA